MTLRLRGYEAVWGAISYQEDGTCPSGRRDSGGGGDAVVMMMMIMTIEYLVS